MPDTDPETRWYSLSPRERRWAERLLTFTAVVALAGAWLWSQQPDARFHGAYAWGLSGLGGLLLAIRLWCTGVGRPVDWQAIGSSVSGRMESGMPSRERASTPGNVG